MPFAITLAQATHAPSDWSVFRGIDWLDEDC